MKLVLGKPIRPPYPPMYCSCALLTGLGTTTQLLLWQPWPSPDVLIADDQFNLMLLNLRMHIYAAIYRGVR
jgi:hypothetical protein